MTSKKSAAIQVASIAAHNSGSIGKIEVSVRESRVIKEKYAEGTIGRDANMRNYIAYLQGRYYEFKKADISYGVDPLLHERTMKGLFPVMNNTIRKKFGAYPNGLPETAFHALEIYMKEKIDKTRLGRRQKKNSHSNYKSFEEFCQLSA